MSEAPESIWIVTEASSLEGARGSGDIGGSLRTPQYSEHFIESRKLVPVEAINQEMEGFLAKIGNIFSHAEAQLKRQQSSMQLDEIELSIEINAEGQISLFGVGGKTGSKGAITLKFKRKELV